MRSLTVWSIFTVWREYGGADGEDFGSYSKWQMCPKFTYASSFGANIETKCVCDNTGLNTVALYCEDPNGKRWLIESLLTNLVSL